jgi:hypothetical protein
MTRYLYRSTIDFNGETCAIETEDGSWWIDWPIVARMAEALAEAQPSEIAAIVRLLLAGRGSIREVSRERIDELAAASYEKPPQWGIDLAAFAPFYVTATIGLTSVINDNRGDGPRNNEQQEIPTP